jgi:hypothetical protein
MLGAGVSQGFAFDNGSPPSWADLVTQLEKVQESTDRHLQLRQLPGGGAVRVLSGKEEEELESRTPL